MQTMDWNTSNERFFNTKIFPTEREMNCILETHIQRTLDLKVMFIYLSNKIKFKIKIIHINLNIKNKIGTQV